LHFVFPVIELDNNLSLSFQLLLYLWGKTFQVMLPRGAMSQVDMLFSTGGDHALAQTPYAIRVESANLGNAVRRITAGIIL